MQFVVTENLAALTFLLLLLQRLIVASPLHFQHHQQLS